MTTAQMMAGSAASVVSCASYDMQRSSSFSTVNTSNTNFTYATDKDNYPSVTFAGNEDDLVSTTTFETRDDRPFSGCMSAIVYDVTDGWYQLEHNVKSCSDIHNCKAPSCDVPRFDVPRFDMPSCNTGSYNCGNSIQTQTATLWIGGSRISCTVPVCSNDTSYDARSSRKAAAYTNLMDMYEYDDDDMSAYSVYSSHSHHGKGALGRRKNPSFSRRSFSLAKSGRGVSRIRSSIAQVGFLGKKVSKPSMNIIKPITNPLRLVRKDREKSQQGIDQDTRDGAESHSFIHAAATEMQESMNRAGSKIESKIKEEQKAILSSIHQETTKLSNSVKIAADATSLVTSHATNTVCDYQQKIMDQHTKALTTRTNAIGQRLVAVEQKMIQANEFLNASHQHILHEANRGATAKEKETDDVFGSDSISDTRSVERETAVPNTYSYSAAETSTHAHDDNDNRRTSCSCTVMDEGSEGIEVVDDNSSMCPSNSTGSSESSCSISSYKYDNRIRGNVEGEDLDGESFNMEVTLSPNGEVLHCDPIDVQTEDTLDAVLDGYHAHDEASQQEMSLSSAED